MDIRSDSDGTSTATTTTVSSRSSKPRRERNRERSKVSAKAVIRHLPPAMTSEEFLAAVDPLPDYNFFYFSKADHGLGQFSFSRAYINFLTFRDMESFRDKFDGYVFVDSRGNEYPAVVEFAPFQKIPQMYWNPKLSEKRDKKCATIEEDADYVSFVQSLSERKNESLPSAETYLEEMEARDKEIRANRGCPKVITPLMEFVLAKYTGKSKQKDDRRMVDDRKHRTRDDKSKKKDDPAAKKNKDKSKDKGKEKSDKSSGLTRKERRNEKRKRDRKDKQAAAGATDVPKNQTSSAPVRVLQKEKPHAKESPAKESAPPKTVPVSKDVTSSSQKSLPNRVLNDHKPKQDRKQPAAAASVAGHRSKPESNTQRESGDRNEKGSKVKRDEVKKERIPNKDRPAIQIYRPGSRRNNNEAGGTKPDSGKSREAGEATKSSETRAENGRKPPAAGAKTDPNRNPKSSSQVPSSKPHTKPDSNAPFRTKVFKSSRKAGSGPPDV